MFHKKIIRFLLFIICVGFMQVGLAQQVTVINQKGTKIDVVNNVVSTSATAPSNPLTADVWFDTTTNIPKIYDGTQWIEIKDADNDATNELSDLSLVGNILTLSNPNTALNKVDLSGFVDTDTHLDAAGISALGYTAGAHTVDTNTQLTESEVDAFTNNNGYLTSFTEVDGSITNEIQAITKSGITISLSDGGGSVNETNTSMIQNNNTGVVTYTREDLSTQTANVVASDSNNSISVGTNGGAFYESPIKAMGKVNSSGSPLRISGASVNRTSTGYYRVTLNSPRSSSNYIIQLTVLEPWSNRDDIIIYVVDQEPDYFDIAITEGDNGTTANTPRNKIWYFVVFDY